MTDPEQIAVSLPENKREALRALFNNDYTNWDRNRISNLWRNLGKRGFHGIVDLGLAQKGPPWRLTPLGIAVYRFIDIHHEGSSS